MEKGRKKGTGPVRARPKKIVRFQKTFATQMRFVNGGHIEGGDLSRKQKKGGRLMKHHKWIGEIGRPESADYGAYFLLLFYNRKNKFESSQTTAK